MSLPANTTSVTNTASSANIASPASMRTKGQKKRAARLMKKMARKYGEETEGQEMMDMKNDDEELSDKVKLDALAKKTQELQGYVNQLQDAVTISMFQLRDLKKQIAAMTTFLATTDE
ncbi:hypothetical protein F4859DRAFT_515830 [Xylaria cf. heliscus]|nr:hypothetical protein F4859DRAFT_515830 [Xylaria cf. heliscus]